MLPFVISITSGKSKYTYDMALGNVPDSDSWAEYSEPGSNSADAKKTRKGRFELRDAREIMPLPGNGSGSSSSSIGDKLKEESFLRGFSDLFRYRLLWKRGGWWADLDVVCVQGWQGMKSHQYVFAGVAYPFKHRVNGNVLKAPKNSPLLKFFIEEIENG